MLTAAQVKEWNAAHPVRSTVLFRKSNGVRVRAQVRCAAELLPSGVAVVRLIGIGGAKSLDRVCDVPDAEKAVRQ